MNRTIMLLSATISLGIATQSSANQTSNPMGIALGNLLVGDYGDQGKVTAAFDPDGTVALTFPDGTSAKEEWIADDDYFCMIRKPGDDGKMSYRCERNMIAGKKIGQRWQQVDSEGLPVTISIQPRPR